METAPLKFALNLETWLDELQQVDFKAKNRSQL